MITLKVLSHVVGELGLASPFLSMWTSLSLGCRAVEYPHGIKPSYSENVSCFSLLAWILPQGIARGKKQLYISFLFKKEKGVESVEKECKNNYSDRTVGARL